VLKSDKKLKAKETHGGCSYLLNSTHKCNALVGEKFPQGKGPKKGHKSINK
jgi:hypothetical protein